jgi:hypothetical protein
MKQSKLLIAAIISILLISSIAATSYLYLNRQEEQPQKPFYVGVTYCGSSVQEAKELIDKVKNYTNLFILQSGPLAKGITPHDITVTEKIGNEYSIVEIWENAAVNEIGDYACAANLNYAVYCSAKISRVFTYR